MRVVDPVAVPLPDAILAVERLVRIEHPRVEGGSHDEALDGRPGLELVLDAAVAPQSRIAARLVRIERRIRGEREHRSALHVHHRHPSGGRAGGGDRARQLAFGRELDGGVDRQRHARSRQLGRIGCSLSEDGRAARITDRLDGNRLASQQRVQLPFQSLLTAVLPDEPEHVPGEGALRIESLRFVHQLDSVEPQRRHARRGRVVDAPPQPDEMLVTGEPRLHAGAVHAQDPGEPVGGRGAFAHAAESARVREDRVDVLGHGQRRSASIGDRSAPRRPFDLAPGLVARQSREARSVEKLHFGGARDDQGKSSEKAQRDERQAEPHPPARLPVRAAPGMPHETSYLEATMEVLEWSAPPTSTMIRSGGGGPMPRRARARSSIRCALPSRAAASWRRSWSRRSCCRSPESRESR